MLQLTPPRVRGRGRGARLEILGVFGAGKTALATALSQGGYMMLPERHDLNAFWTDSAANQAVGYLAYDLWFLLHHAQLAASHSAGTSNRVAVCDWSFLSDHIWARMRLEDDLPLYEGIYRTLRERVGPPFGYLYLKQQPEIVIERLKRRGRQGETGFAVHIRRAVRLLDEVVGLLSPQMVMVVSDQTGMLEINEQVACWQKEVFDGR